jgi:hypothetical protein
MCEGVEGRRLAEYARLSHAERVAELARIQRARAGLDAAEARLLHAMHADPLPDIDGSPAVDKQWVREDVACVKRIAPQTAAQQLHEASELVTRLPATLALLERDEISVLHARRLSDAVRPLADDRLVARVEKRVLARAARQSVAEFGAAVRRAVLALDPRDAEQRHQDAVAGRRVVFRAQPDGIIDLYAALPAAGALALRARIEAEAARYTSADAAAGISRNADQRRADALINLTAGTPVDGTPAPGLRPAVQVTVALSTLLGLDAQPGELDGYGPIPAALARVLAFDPSGTWRRLLTDRHARLVDVTSHTYRPPAPIARLVRLQQPRCRFPGCRRRAARCDLDHVTPWPAGPTSAANLHTLCSRHHKLKHEAGWTPRSQPDGTTAWRSPSGHTYRKPPDDLPRDTIPDPPADDAEPPF